MSVQDGSLGALNRIPGVRGWVVAGGADGLVVESDVMIGVPEQSVAAFSASLFGRARRSLRSADLGEVAFLQMEAERGYLFVAGQAGGELLLAVLADTRVNVGLVRLRVTTAAEQLA